MHDASQPTSGAITVTALYRYPIKSCRGQALTDAEFVERGIAHDREFLVIDPASGRFLTQRELPRMALIAPTLVEGGLKLSAPNVPEITFERITQGPTLPVTVWKDTVEAVDQGDAVADWLTQLLGRPSRLVRMDEDFVRPVDPKYAVGPNAQVGFADGFPALLISEESLAELNRRLVAQGSQRLPMNRFRPNIVVRGAGLPHTEDTWRHILAGDVAFAVVKPCARCQITTTDQATGERGHEPLRILARYRRSRGGVTFGQNLIHTTQGRISVGDRVEVLASTRDADRGA